MKKLDDKKVRMSLNGIPFDDAQQMVKKFPGVLKYPKTNIWFKRAFIDSIYDLLHTEDGDGIRVYFAVKDPTDPKSDNTVVIVSTWDDGPSFDGNRSGRVHLDYFGHDPEFLPLSAVQNEDDADGSAKGASLYTDLPCVEDNCNKDNPSYISCEDAKRWVANLKGGHIKTKSVWYGIEVIEEIKAQLDAAPEEIGADGVRLYFAKDDAGVERFIFVRTVSDRDKHLDDQMCYSFGFLGANDHGEECPVFCKGTALP